MSREERHVTQVVIAGGGVAAIEALLALHELASHRVHTTMIAPQRDFLYRPVTVAEAFGRAEARAYSLGEIVGRAHGELLWDSVEEVETDAGVVVTASGDRVPYDRLIVAAGAIACEPLPGALTFRGRADVAPLRQLLDELAEGGARSVAFTLSSEHVWPLPIYELALLTGSHLRDRGAATEVWLLTPEEEPLQLFGPAASRAIEAMLSARGVRLRTSSRPALVRDRSLLLMGGGELHVDRVVTLPVLQGPNLPGLPADQNGFVPVDGYGLVRGQVDIYAAGDVTSFPLKQGGLATQQADVVAEMIAAELGLPITPAPFRPVLRGLLITGGAPLYLRAEPQRLPRASSVAIEATPLRRTSRDASAAAGQPLWWPPAKVAGRYLAPYLASVLPEPLSRELLTDRAPVAGPALNDEEFDDALELALLLADCDARWGDYTAALSALDAAEALQGALPPEYEHKRRHWRAAEHAA